MGKQTDSFYNKFSFLYPLVDVALKPQKKVLFNHINRLHEGKLLEIGVGNGSHFKYYKKHRVTGIDTSEAMLQIARKKMRENITVFKMNGEALLFDDEEFDYAVLSHVLAVVDDPEQLIKEVLRVLKPHGQVFILNHFTPNNWLGLIDRAFERISKIFFFKSVFSIDQIAAMKNFNLLTEVNFGMASYFKLLIYQKK